MWPQAASFPSLNLSPSSAQCITMNSRSLWVCKLWYLIFWFYPCWGQANQPGAGWVSPCCWVWRYKKPPLNRIIITMFRIVTNIFVERFTKNISTNAPATPARGSLMRGELSSPSPGNWIPKGGQRLSKWSTSVITNVSVCLPLASPSLGAKGSPQTLLFSQIFFFFT